jgi:hypothetical protein
MKALASSPVLAILATVPLIALLIIHEVLALVDDGSDRFSVSRGRITIAVWILVAVTAALVGLRFGYLR